MKRELVAFSVSVEAPSSLAAQVAGIDHLHQQGARTILEFLADHPNPGQQYMVVKYEDIYTDVERQMARILASSEHSPQRLVTINALVWRVTAFSTSAGSIR